MLPDHFVPSPDVVGAQFCGEAGRSRQICPIRRDIDLSPACRAAWRASSQRPSSTSVANRSARASRSTTSPPGVVKRRCRSASNSAAPRTPGATSVTLGGGIGAPVWAIAPPASAIVKQAAHNGENFDIRKSSSRASIVNPMSPTIQWQRWKSWRGPATALEKSFGAHSFLSCLPSHF